MSRIRFDGLTGDELRQRIKHSGMSPKQEKFFSHLCEDYLKYLQETDNPITFEEWLKMTQP